MAVTWRHPAAHEDQTEMKAKLYNLCLFVSLLVNKDYVYSGESVSLIQRNRHRFSWNYADDGQSYSLERLSSNINVANNRIFHTIHRFRNTGSRPGGPRKTTPDEDDAIIRAAREQPLTNAKAIHEDLGLEVSSMTVQRRLYAAGIHHRAPATKELLTERH
ncbi:uncharacterized protein LOC135204179 isoform X4 [Macrobrachium nipponense]|uniref:uncharacterized protein LOC135204179 isoform X4 n=2 Tax=Macrobrachium nipponense TaxID=159736 RepID=UPI0030C86C53